MRIRNCWRASSLLVLVSLLPAHEAQAQGNATPTPLATRRQQLVAAGGLDQCQTYDALNQRYFVVAGAMNAAPGQAAASRRW